MAMSDRAHIPLAPEHTQILRQCRKSFCDAVKGKFGCTAIFHNVEEPFGNSFGSYRTDILSSEIRYSTTLSSGVKISVWKDDLTRHQVDAVVNAANENLDHAGGLALALSEAGGPEINDYSRQVIKERGKVPTGTAVITPSGKLPCDLIIHAVGPHLPLNPTRQEIDSSKPFLRAAIKSILKMVVDGNIKSVAIPALSSGLFNFPRDLCARIIVQTIKDDSDSNSFKGRTFEIHLVNNDEPTVQEMERACRMLLSSTDTLGSYSGALKGRNHSMISSSINTVKFGNVPLYLKKGYIEEEKVDVIVNTIANDLNLSKGEISKAILKKAGRKIQEEISREKKHLAKEGDIFVTQGYGLNCRFVLHTVCSARSEPNAEKILYEVVKNCLKKSVGEMKSIAFPAIGTGLLGYGKQTVAKIMTNAVADFASTEQSHMKKLDVYFVVFPKDDEMMKAFEKEINFSKVRMRPSENSRDTPIDSVFGYKETTTKEPPTLELNSLSDEVVREAKAWMFKILRPSTTITINNNHVIYLGQKEHSYLLSLQTIHNVQIEEFFRNGHGGISITGNPTNVSCAAFKVEALLCQVQEEFAQAEERDTLNPVLLWQVKDEPQLQTPEPSAGDNANSPKSASISFYRRTPVKEDHLKKEIRKGLEANGLCIIKVEKIDNVALQKVFELNKKRVRDEPKQLYQRVSAQFCDLICRVGFQKEFAPPTEQKYGHGIYFSSSVEEALKLWRKQFEDEQYIYIIQTQVLTGKSTIGTPDLILPPSQLGDSLDRYDSVSDKRQTHVIFSGYQALPEYLIICHKSSPV